MVYQSSQLSKCFQTLIAGRAEKKAAAHSAEATTTLGGGGEPAEARFSQQSLDTRDLGSFRQCNLTRP